MLELGLEIPSSFPLGKLLTVVMRAGKLLNYLSMDKKKTIFMIDVKVTGVQCTNTSVTLGKLPSSLVHHVLCSNRVTERRKGKR